MMTRIKKTAWITTGLIGGVLLLAVLTPRNGMKDTHVTSVDETVQKYRIDRPVMDVAHKAPEKQEKAQSMDGVSPLEDRDAFVNWAVESLKKDLGESIGSKSTQASLLKLRMFLAEHYPEKWKELFRDIVQGAFPERADAIFEFIAKKDHYNQWYEENKHLLATLDYAEIKDALKAKQDEVFGEDAGEIRADMAGDLLGILSDAYDTSLDKKISLFTQMIQDNDGSTAVPVLDESKFYMSRAFFRMDSVQENLKNLSDSEREQAIGSVRQALGYSEEDIEKLARMDAKRDETWQIGYQYMADRSALTLAYEGNELDQQLYDLQERYFGKQARTIRAEETSGFFRFQRPRIYGSN